MNVAPVSVEITLSGGMSMLPAGRSPVPLPIRGGRIASSVHRSAYSIDLRDHLIFPGLINAHDHLQVNAVPPLPSHGPFPNSYAWIDAIQAHLNAPEVVAALDVPKALRLRHGALKNLLAGVTCVAHHDPWHRELDAVDFPVALLRDFGWSYALSGPEYGPPVSSSFAATPADQPWLIHLAEGTDAVARAELAQLDALGCLAANSVLIHGVGFRDEDMDRVIDAGAAVVWCPVSNRSLLGRSLDPRRLNEAGRLILGSDSRLSGARDLLDEMRHVLDRGDMDASQLLVLVTTRAADILRLPLHGRLQAGLSADLVVVADHGGVGADSLIGLERSQIRAVVRHGLPQIADPDFAEWFALTETEAVPVALDGKPKLLARSLADPALLALEKGLECSDIFNENRAALTAGTERH